MIAPSGSSSTVERLIVQDVDDAPISVIKKQKKAKSSNKPLQKTAKKNKVTKSKIKSETKLQQQTHSKTKKITSKRTTNKKPSNKKLSPTSISTKKKPTSKSQSTTTKKEKGRSSIPDLKYSSYTPTLPIIKRAPLGHLFIEQLLREAGFRGGISSDKKILERYSTDESIFAVQPQLVIQPRNKEDVEIATKVVAREIKRFSALSLTPRALGFGLSGGSLSDSIVLDVSAHMNNIEEPILKKDGVYITCEPGAMWYDVENKLKSLNAYLPSGPALKDQSSIGGSVSSNSEGKDSIRHGRIANEVVSLDVILRDGNTYTIEALTYSEFKKLIKKKNAYADIAKNIFTIIEQNEQALTKVKPLTDTTAGYPLCNVITESVDEFKKGNGRFDLSRIICGSQGSIGIIVAITLKAEFIHKNTTLLVVPIFNLADASKVVSTVHKYNPLNIEMYDATSFDLALKNPKFFKSRLGITEYYKVMFSMYTTYHIRYARKIPEFTLLITLDEETTNEHEPKDIAKHIRDESGVKAKIVNNPNEIKMFEQIANASYSLAKLYDPNKRPAAFLEDMTVPPANFSRFFIDIKRLLTKYNLKAIIQGHGADGHFHIYPLIDFTNKSTPALIKRMSEEFFNIARKYRGEICGDHNDGILRTPNLSNIFNKNIIFN